MPSTRLTDGFTLIEMSIVLVIIGLIIGGVLVGRDLISAAEVRAQISQIEKYQTAVNTFRVKYGYVPGDIPDPVAAQFGFVSRGINQGQGDGNGVIEGAWCNTGNAGCPGGWIEGAGETPVFWSDLSLANLIEGVFTAASSTTEPAAPITGTGLNDYFPAARIGRNNFVYVWSGGWTLSNGTNYYGLSIISSLSNSFATAFGSISSTPGISSLQALNIDTKMDDGLPQVGAVIALYLNGVGNVARWAAGTGVGAYDPATKGAVVAGDGVTTAPSTTTCYDNGSVAGGTEMYTVSQNGGSGINCALSFRFR